MDALQLDEDVESVLDATVQDAQEVEDMLLQELEHRNQLLLRARGVITSLQADYETLYQEAGAAAFRDARPPPHEDVAVLTDDISSTLYDSEFGLGIFEGEPCSPSGFDRDPGGARAHTAGDTGPASQPQPQQVSSWGPGAAGAAVPPTRASMAPLRGMAPLPVPKVLAGSSGPGGGSGSSPISPQHRRAVLGAGGVFLQKSHSMPLASLAPLVLPKGGGVPAGPRSPHLKADVVGSLRPSPLGVVSPTAEEWGAVDHGFGASPVEEGAEGSPGEEGRPDGDRWVGVAEFGAGSRLTAPRVSSSGARGQRQGDRTKPSRDAGGSKATGAGDAGGGDRGPERGEPHTGGQGFAPDAPTGTRVTDDASAGMVRAGGAGSRGSGALERRGGDQVAGDVDGRRMGPQGAEVVQSNIKETNSAGQKSGESGPGRLKGAAQGSWDDTGPPSASRAEAARVTSSPYVDVGAAAAVAEGASAATVAVAGGRSHRAHTPQDTEDDWFPLERLHDWLEAGTRGDAELAGRVHGSGHGREDEARAARRGIAPGHGGVGAGADVYPDAELSVAAMRFDPSGEAVASGSGGHGAGHARRSGSIHPQEAAVVLPSQLPRPPAGARRPEVVGGRAVSMDGEAAGDVQDAAFRGVQEMVNEDGMQGANVERTSFSGGAGARVSADASNAGGVMGRDASDAPWQDGVVFPSMELGPRAGPGGTRRTSLSSRTPSRIPAPSKHGRGAATAGSSSSLTTTGTPIGGASGSSAHTRHDDAHGRDGVGDVAGDGGDIITHARVATTASDSTAGAMERGAPGLHVPFLEGNPLPSEAMAAMPGTGSAPATTVPGGLVPDGVGAVQGQLVPPSQVRKGWLSATPSSAGELVRAVVDAGAADVTTDPMRGDHPATNGPTAGEPMGQSVQGSTRGDGSDRAGEASPSTANGGLRPSVGVPRGSLSSASPSLSVGAAERGAWRGEEAAVGSALQAPPSHATRGAGSGTGDARGTQRGHAAGVMGSSGGRAEAGSATGSAALGSGAGAGGQVSSNGAVGGELPSRIPLPGQHKQAVSQGGPDGARTEWDDTFATEASNLSVELGSVPGGSANHRNGAVPSRGASLSSLVCGPQGSDRFDLDTQADWAEPGEYPGVMARHASSDNMCAPAVAVVARASSAPWGRPPTGPEDVKRESSQTRLRSASSAGGRERPEPLDPGPGADASAMMAPERNHRGHRSASGSSRSSSTSAGGGRGGHGGALAPFDRVHTAEPSHAAVAGRATTAVADSLAAALPPPQLRVPPTHVDALTQQLMRFKAKYSGAAAQEGAGRVAQGAVDASFAPGSHAFASMPAFLPGAEVPHGRDELLFSASEEDMLVCGALPGAAPTHSHGGGGRGGHMPGGSEHGATRPAVYVPSSGGMHRSQSSQGLADSPGAGRSRDRDGGKHRGMRKSTSFVEVGGAEQGLVRPAWGERDDRHGSRGGRRVVLATDSGSYVGEGRGVEGERAGGSVRGPPPRLSESGNDSAGHAGGSRGAHAHAAARWHDEAGHQAAHQGVATLRHDHEGKGHEEGQGHWDGNSHRDRYARREGHEHHEGPGHHGGGRSRLARRSDPVASLQMPGWERELLDQLDSFRRSMNARVPAHARAKGDTVGDDAAARHDPGREHEGRGRRERSRDSREPALLADGSSVRGDVREWPLAHGVADVGSQGRSLDVAHLHARSRHGATNTSVGSQRVTGPSPHTAAGTAAPTVFGGGGTHAYGMSSTRTRSFPWDGMLPQQAAVGDARMPTPWDPAVAVTSAMEASTSAAPGDATPAPTARLSFSTAFKRAPVAASWDNRLERAEAWRTRDEGEQLQGEGEGRRSPRQRSHDKDAAVGGADVGRAQHTSAAFSGRHWRGVADGKDTRRRQRAAGGDMVGEDWRGELAGTPEGAEGVTSRRRSRSRSRSGSRSRRQHKAGATRPFLSPELVLHHTLQRAWGRLDKGQQRHGGGAHLSPSSRTSSGSSASEDEGAHLQRMVVAGDRARDLRKRLTLASGWLFDDGTFDGAAVSMPAGQMQGEAGQRWDHGAAAGVASVATFLPTAPLPLTTTAAGPGWCIHVARDESCQVELRSTNGVAVVSVVHSGVGSAQNSLHGDNGMAGFNGEINTPASELPIGEASTEVPHAGISLGDGEVARDGSRAGEAGEAGTDASIKASAAGDSLDTTASMGPVPGTGMAGNVSAAVADSGGRELTPEQPHQLSEQLARLERQLMSLVEKHANRLPELVRAAAGDVSSSDEMPPSDGSGRWAAPLPLARWGSLTDEEEGSGPSGLGVRDGMQLSAGRQDQGGVSARAEGLSSMNGMQAADRSSGGQADPRVYGQGEAGARTNTAVHESHRAAWEPPSIAGARSSTLARGPPGEDALEIATKLLDRDLDELKAECSSAGSYLSSPRWPTHHSVAPASMSFFSPVARPF
eukprot:jgi/Mesvir1/2325/Mv19351-RA.1